MNRAVNERLGGAIRWQLKAIRTAQVPAECVPGADSAPAQDAPNVACGKAPAKEPQGRT